MELSRDGRVGSTSRRRVGLLFVAVSIFHFSVIVGQKPVVFQYGSVGQIADSKGNPITDYTLQVPGIPNIGRVDNANLTCLRDFQQIGSSSDKLIPGEQSDEGLLMNLPVHDVGIQQGVDVFGRCLYRNPVRLIQSCDSSPTVTSFSSMFVMSIFSPIYEASTGSGSSGTLQGLAFIITNDSSTQGEPGGYLGWLNSTTNGRNGQNFAVELDFFQDAQFNDPVGAHVGIDINSLNSKATNSVGLWGDFLTQDVGGPLGVGVWIDYDGPSQILEVYVNGYMVNYDKPATPLLSLTVDLSGILSQEGMYVGFSGSISNVTFPQSLENNGTVDGLGVGYLISLWTFNSNGPAPDMLRDPNGATLDPALERKNKHRERIIVISVTTIPSVLIVLVLVFVICVLYRRNARLIALAKKYEIEDGLLDRGPQNFKHKVLSIATKGFSSHELLGSGGFGSVYRGRLCLQRAEKPTDVAVKRISANSHQGAREFLAEVKIIGQVQHRNLVRLLGWCHEKGELLLVYDYMPNGSVDQHLFKNTDAPGESLLTWSRRLKIVSGVAMALAYLHEEWEQRVIHRDVKSSNVMLDRDFNARLGDFGLARLSEHDQAPPSTVALAGTYGYLAPEIARTLKATEKTDVYSFGAMVLEVATGKRPILSVQDRAKYNELLLVDWVWGLYRNDALLEAADCGLQTAFDPAEMIMLLKIGLLCSHPDPDERPNMREVLNIWKCSSPFPPLPRTKPVPVFTRCLARTVGVADTTVTISTDDYGHSDEAMDRRIALHSDGHSRLVTSSTDDGNSPLPLQTLQGRTGGSPMPALRYRPSNTSTPLPL